MSISRFEILTCSPTWRGEYAVISSTGASLKKREEAVAAEMEVAMREKAIVMLLIASVGCCACSEQQPNYTKRHKTLSIESKKRCDEAGVKGTVFVFKPTKTEKTILDLTEGAQTALIEGLLSSHEANPEGVWTKLLAPLEDGRTRQTGPDLTKFRRAVVLSLANTSTNPADRISEADLTLAIRGRGSFVSWDRITTDFGEVDLGKITAADTRTVGLEGSVGGTTPAGAELNLTPKLSRENKLEEEVVFTRRYVALTGTIREGRVNLLQQSAAGVDLTGNATFVVNFAVDQDTKSRTLMYFGNLFRSPVEANPGAQVTLRFATARYFDPAGSIEADPSLKFRVRQVKQGTETITESDDEVAALEGGCALEPAPLVLVEAQDTRFSTWQLSARDKILSIARVRGASERSPDAMEVDFHNSSAAHLFLSWLRFPNTAKNGVDGRPLYLCDRGRVKGDVGGCSRLRRDDVSALTVTEFGWNFTD